MRKNAGANSVIPSFKLIRAYTDVLHFFYFVLYKKIQVLFTNFPNLRLDAFSNFLSIAGVPNLFRATSKTNPEGSGTPQ